MKFKIDPIIFIYLLGLTGLMFTFIDDSGEMGSKVPLSLFFIVVIIIAIVIQVAPKDRVDGIFGEVESSRDFG